MVLFGGVVVVRSILVHGLFVVPSLNPAKKIFGLLKID
jgi:hypothetical protein